MTLKTTNEVIKADYETLPGRKLAQAKLGDVLIIGLGVSGKASVNYLAPMLGGRVSSLTVLGGDRTDDAENWARSVMSEYQEAASAGILQMIFDTEDAESVAPEDGFFLGIASPGISMFSDFYQSAHRASKRLIGELEFAWEESSEDSVWVAITGTNGKTTTTMLTEHILKEAGLNAHALGNVGFAAIETVSKQLSADDGAPFFIAEASSYQLASTQYFAPEVAIVLGITPDHIKWHQTHEHYKSSKFKLLENLKYVEDAVAVLDATNDEVREKVRELRSQSPEVSGFDYIPIGTAKGVDHDMRNACGSANAAFVDEEHDDDMLVALRGEEHDGGSAKNLNIKGTHNRVNALAAMSAGVALDVSDGILKRALSTFEPLEHRIEPVGTCNGVLYVNDSKATNVDATIQAVAAFYPKKPIVLLGGRDKGTALDALVASCIAHAKSIICFGEAKDRFAEAFDGTDLDLMVVSGFDQAFETASSIAGDGDIVLLSPACASFDEFSCFEERGDHFKELFRSLQERSGSSSLRG